MLKPFSDRVSGLQPSAIREILKFIADPEVISFAAGNPAPEAFPVETIAKLSADIFREEPINALQYSITEGYPKLREWLKADLTKKGLFRDGDQVVITSGAQQAIETTAKILCNEGDVIICEDPAFVGSLNAFRSYGVKLVGVPMDDDGMKPDSLEEALNRSITYCYAVEGAYPESLEYLTKHYGLTYDHDRFFVDYHVSGANLYPDVTILEVK